MNKKASNYLDAAQRIIDANDASICFASIHCSYYSVFQYMKFILANLNTRPYSYEQQDATPKSGSHETILLQIRNRLNLKTSDLRDFCDTLSLLKKQRKIADYTDTTFTIEECLDAKNKAISLRAVLKSQFGNKIN